MPIELTGSLGITGSLYVNGTQMDSVSSSYAVTASYAENAVVTGSNAVTYTASVLELGGDLYRNTYVTGTLDGLADFFMPDGRGFTSGSSNSFGTIYLFDKQTEKFYFSGLFNAHNGIDLSSFSSGFARFNKDGTLDTSFSAGIGFYTGSNRTYPLYRTSCKIDSSSGKIYIGGNFNQYSGSSVGYGLIRLNSNGSIDTSFNVGTGFSGRYQTNTSVVVNAIDIDLNGKIYAVGNFTQYSGSTVGPDIVRINQDGTIDTSFNNNVGNLLPAGSGTTLWYVKVEPVTNKVYFSGWMTAYSGSTGFSGLVKANPDGTIDNTFVASPGMGIPPYTVSYPTGWINAQDTLIIDKNLNAYLIGFFPTWNGVTVNGIVKINSSGSIDTSFNVGDGITTSLVANTYNQFGNGSAPYLDDYDRLLLYGAPKKYSGSVVSGSCRILPNGNIDPDFPSGSLLFFNTSSSTLATVNSQGVFPSVDKKKVYVMGSYNWQNGYRYLSGSSGSNYSPVRVNIVDPEISIKTGGFSYDSDYSQFYTTRSLIDKGYTDNRFTGSLYLTGSLYVSGTVNFSNLFSLVPQDPLPTNLPTASIASSGSGVNNVPYYWNGSTWTSLIP